MKNNKEETTKNLEEKETIFFDYVSVILDIFEQ